MLRTFAETILTTARASASLTDVAAVGRVLAALPDVMTVSTLPGRRVHLPTEVQPGLSGQLMTQEGRQ